MTFYYRHIVCISIFIRNVLTYNYFCSRFRYRKRKMGISRHSRYSYLDNLTRGHRLSSSFSRTPRFHKTWSCPGLCSSKWTVSFFRWSSGHILSREGNRYYRDISGSWRTQESNGSCPRVGQVNWSCLCYFERYQVSILKSKLEISACS